MPKSTVFFREFPTGKRFTLLNHFKHHQEEGVKLIIEKTDDQNGFVHQSNDEKKFPVGKKVQIFSEQKVVEIF